MQCRIHDDYFPDRSGWDSDLNSPRVSENGVAISEDEFPGSSALRPRVFHRFTYIAQQTPDVAPVALNAECSPFPLNDESQIFKEDQAIQLSIRILEIRVRQRAGQHVA